MTVPLPAPARAIAAAVTEAVDAALAADAAAYARATEALAALDAEAVRVLLGGVVRALLEEGHPDGLAGEDLQAVLERTARASATWAPGVDVDALVVVLTGALGIHDGEDAAPLAPLAVTRHAVLLVADLLRTSGVPLRPRLDAALIRLAEAELNEYP